MIDHMNHGMDTAPHAPEPASSEPSSPRGGRPCARTRPGRMYPALRALPAHPRRGGPGPDLHLEREPAHRRAPPRHPAAPPARARRDPRPDRGPRLARRPTRLPLRPAPGARREPALPISHRLGMRSRGVPAPALRERVRAPPRRTRPGALARLRREPQRPCLRLRAPRAPAALAGVRARLRHGNTREPTSRPSGRAGYTRSWAST